MGEFDREPIFWTTTRPGYNQRDRERVRHENGQKIVERVPQVGHQGTYEQKTKARVLRYWTVVKHDGHVIPYVLSSGAADASQSMVPERRAKMRYHGWYPISACPCALLATGDLKRGHFVDQLVAAERPCEPGSYNEEKPCKHAIAERDARRAQHTAKEAERMKNFRDPTERLIEANREQTTAVVAGVVEAINGTKAPKK